MRRLLVGETEIQGVPTAYFLLEKELETAVHYGVEIVRGEERASAEGLSFSGDHVWALARQMLDGTVTPVALQDIVDDWLLR